MNTGSTKATSNGFENSLRPEEEQNKQINEMRKLIGPLSGKLALYCSDASISRYLMARSWNVKKAARMLKATLKWRSEYKPEEIRWDDVASEAETGKIYRSNYTDKQGRTVLVMRPRCQNTKSVKGQIKYLVYCMENAVVNLPEDQEQMVWLIDFHGFNLSHISIKVTKETAHVLQEHYPERLGIAILYDAPKIFEPFWKVAKPFLDPKTASKVNFVYSDDPNSKKIMEELFDMRLLESAFGGDDKADFDINKYAERMREDDKKLSSFWKKDNNSAASAQPTVVTSEPSLEPTNSESDSDALDEKVDKLSLDVDEEESPIEETLPGTDSTNENADRLKQCN
ncbi:uncharacterized protein LOC107783862 isoform X1 [Nicotiana tabacum]|uniref:Random slug protein 5 isoform X1 n=1 Tax=Nicotiana tabacum TaxID=4097 RepID=A0A1S3Z7C5_TOBAC|nr:PREDICTED: random slug protein 5-like isoform X1 [Nicotiana tabacum]XP_016460376.1 PREDICTED: random slug protein 5-like isoform X1 [Nicotiana tabacum]